MAINKKVLATALTATASLAAVGTIAATTLTNQQQSIVLDRNNQQKPQNIIEQSNQNNQQKPQNIIEQSNQNNQQKPQNIIEQSNQNNQQKPQNTIGEINNNNKPSTTQPVFSQDTRKAYSASISPRFSTFARTAEKTDWATAKYVMSISENTKLEGVAEFLPSLDANETQQQIEFTPGTTIYVKIQLKKGFEDYTARELRIIGKNPNYRIPSNEVEGRENVFQIKMPTYDETLDKKTGESWLYGENAGDISLVPTFIKKSIGTEGNKVDWDHGSLHDTFNGYVYELTENKTWTSATEEIYKTFENKDINYPIDIFFYMNGHTITFDVDTINLNIPSGWALHFYNNKNDTATDGKYGEIKVGGNRQHAELPVGGSLTLGSSVKFKQYAGSTGIRFVNFNDNSGLVADFIENDPAVRFGK